MTGLEEDRGDGSIADSPCCTADRRYPRFHRGLSKSYPFGVFADIPFSTDSESLKGFFIFPH
jgi:hypothetical protein